MELSEKDATIPFRGRITEKKVVTLMNYIRNETGANVQYFPAYVVSVDENGVGKYLKEPVSLSLTHPKNLAYAQFTLEREVREHRGAPMFKGMEFSPIGRDLDELSEEEIELVTGTRRAVEKYLSDNP